MGQIKFPLLFSQCDWATRGKEAQREAPQVPYSPALSLLPNAGTLWPSVLLCLVSCGSCQKTLDYIWNLENSEKFPLDTGFDVFFSLIDLHCFPFQFFDVQIGCCSGKALKWWILKAYKQPLKLIFLIFQKICILLLLKIFTSHSPFPLWSTYTPESRQCLLLLFCLYIAH